MRNLIGKASRYMQEIRFCFRTGADLPARLGLSWATLRFHFRNALGERRTEASEAARRFRLRIAGQPRDVWLRVHSGDLFVLYEVFLDLCYRLPARDREAPIGTVVDLGANVGLATLYYSALFPEARFVCVEPSPENLRLLTKNLAFLAERATILAGAVSAASGEAFFDPSPASWGGALSADSKGVRVRSWSMPEILKQTGLKRVDLLKIDIEGGEANLLKEASDWSQNIARIIIELHGDYSPTDLRRDLPASFEILQGGSGEGNAMLFCRFRQRR